MLRDCLEGLQAGTPSHIYVPGKHGTGKTSFLEHAVEVALGMGLMAARVDAARAPGREQVLDLVGMFLDEVDKTIEERSLRSATRLAEDWNAGKMSTLFLQPKRDRLNTTALARDLTRLTKVLADFGYDGAVLCVDEAQELSTEALQALSGALWRNSTVLAMVSLQLRTDYPDLETAGRTEMLKKAGTRESVSSLFGTAIPMGPFDTEQEALACITKRVRESGLTFTSESMRHICRIESRVPRRMIYLARTADTLARSRHLPAVDESILQAAFWRVHPDASREIAEVLAGLGSEARRHLRQLSDHDRGATPREIAREIYGNADGVRDGFVQTVRNDLDLVCDRNDWCQKDDDGRFRITSVYHSYAIRFSTGSTSGTS